MFDVMEDENIRARINLSHLKCLRNQLQEKMAHILQMDALKFERTVAVVT